MAGVPTARRRRRVGGGADGALRLSVSNPEELDARVLVHLEEERRDLSVLQRVAQLGAVRVEHDVTRRPNTPWPQPQSFWRPRNFPVWCLYSLSTRSLKIAGARGEVLVEDLALVQRLLEAAHLVESDVAVLVPRADLLQEEEDAALREGSAPRALASAPRTPAGLDDALEAARHRLWCLRRMVGWGREVARPESRRSAGIPAADTRTATRSAADSEAFSRGRLGGRRCVLYTRILQPAPAMIKDGTIAPGAPSSLLGSRAIVLWRCGRAHFATSTHNRSKLYGGSTLTDRRALAHPRTWT